MLSRPLNVTPAQIITDSRLPFDLDNLKALESDILDLCRHRVIINQSGDLIVRPSFVEASYQRKQFGGPPTAAEDMQFGADAWSPMLMLEAGAEGG